MKKLKVLKYSDSHLWYASLVGTLVPYVRSIHSENVYMSRDGGGFLNIVYMNDAEIVEEEL